MKKVITIEEAYEMAVSAIPGPATASAFNVCRDEVRANLARIFEHGEKGVDNLRYKPVDSEGKSGA